MTVVFNQFLLTEMLSNPQLSPFLRDIFTTPQEPTVSLILNVLQYQSCIASLIETDRSKWVKLNFIREGWAWGINKLRLCMLIYLFLGKESVS